MSKRKPMVLLMIAVILGFLATSSMAKYMEKQTGPASGTMVQTAAVNLVPGTMITKEHLNEVPWPAPTVPETLITDPDDAVNKYVSAAIAAGEPVLRNRISEMNLSGDIIGYIPPGYRAMTIKIDRAVKAGGLLAPGSFVDVITVITERGYEPVSRIILQNIKVLSVGSRPMDPEDKEKRGKPQQGTEEAVTLLLLPDEAEKLALAITRGKIQLMARGASDTAATVTTGSSPLTLMPEPKEPDKPKPADAVPAPGPPPQQPQETAEIIYSRALSAEAKGDVDLALKLYAQVAGDFPPHKLAAEAVKRSNDIRAAAEQRQHEQALEKELSSTETALGNGMFDQVRERTARLLQQFGTVTYKGEQISDIVGKLKLRATNDEKKARIEFQLCRNWLQNGNVNEARKHLKNLEQDYPQSTYYQQAAKLYESATSASAAAAPQAGKEPTDDTN